MLKPATVLFVSGLLVSALPVSAPSAVALPVFHDCEGESDRNCYEEPLFDYADDGVDAFIENESVCLRGEFTQRNGGEMLSAGLYMVESSGGVNSCGGIQDINSAATPVTVEDRVKLVFRTSFKPEITRGNANFQSSVSVPLAGGHWKTTVITRPILDFMMGPGSSCLPYIVDEPSIPGFTSGCPNTAANRIASGVIEAKVSMLLAEWTSDGGAPAELKGLIMGFNGTDLVWRPDVESGGFKFWMAGPHLIPRLVDGVQRNVENNLGSFKVFIPKAAIALFTSLRVSQQNSPEAVQSEIELTYQDNQGLTDSSPDTAGAMIEQCLSLGGEVDLVNEECVKNGQPIELSRIRATEGSVIADPNPLEYQITEGENGWWIESEPYGFSSPKIVTQKRINGFSTRITSPSNRVIKTVPVVKITWARASLATVFGTVPAQLYRIRLAKNRNFSGVQVQQFMTNKLHKTFRGLRSGTYFVSITPILGSAGTGWGQEARVQFTVRRS